jgi:hypothetical protein
MATAATATAPMPPTTTQSTAEAGAEDPPPELMGWSERVRGYDEVAFTTTELWAEAYPPLCATAVYAPGYAITTNRPSASLTTFADQAVPSAVVPVIVIDAEARGRPVSPFTTRPLTDTSGGKSVRG